MVYTAEWTASWSFLLGLRKAKQNLLLELLFASFSPLLEVRFFPCRTKASFWSDRGSLDEKGVSEADYVTVLCSPTPETKTINRNYFLYSSIPVSLMFTGSFSVDSHFQGGLVWDPRGLEWGSGSDPITNLNFLACKTRDQEQSMMILKDTSSTRSLFEEIMSLISRSFA